MEDKLKAIPCKHFHKLKGCRRGNKCWFYHDQNHKADKKSTISKQNANTKIRAEQNKDKESKQEAMDTANQEKGTTLK